MQFARNALLITLVALACGCSIETPHNAEQVRKTVESSPTSPTLTVRVSASAKTASMTITNLSNKAVIVSPRLDFLVAYVARSDKKTPITYSAWDAEMTRLSALDCVRLSPGDSFSTNRGLDLRLSGPIAEGESVVAVLHALHEGVFDADSRRVMQSGYSGELLTTIITSERVEVAK